MTYSETNLVDTIERLAAVELTTLTQAQRDQFDQFRSGGAEAVARLLPDLQLAPGMTVLDVGAGFGGPARQIARSAGCAVVGVDITPAYVETARSLTRDTGLEDLVTFVCADISTLPRHQYDAGYTIHVQMNVEDKRSFFTGIAQRLKPGARFAVFEVCRRGPISPAYPLPWSLDGTDSHLATTDELHEAVTAGGFETIEWADDTGWVLDWFAGVADRLASAANGATLAAVLDDGPTRLMNFAAALSGGLVSIQRGVFKVVGAD